VNREKAPLERQIAGCTSLIQSAKKSDSDLAIAFSNRGNAWRLKGEVDRAIADYDQAIKRDPRSASVFVNRSAAYDAKGQHDRAIRDYDEAIKLDRRSPVAFNNRGFAYYSIGQHDRAIPASHADRSGPCAQRRAR
jgi:tetratricopeptide (TPR) repeat protein